MGSLLKSFSRLARIQYWVSGLRSARIEACLRFLPQRFLEAAKGVSEERQIESGVQLNKSYSKAFTDISRFVRGMIQSSDLHKDDREGLPG
jgi:hypothetical protein